MQHPCYVEFSERPRGRSGCRWAKENSGSFPIAPGAAVLLRQSSESVGVTYFPEFGRREVAKCTPMHADA